MTMANRFCASQHSILAIMRIGIAGQAGNPRDSG
jgi:hypothetical protein